MGIPKDHQPWFHFSGALDLDSGQLRAKAGAWGLETWTQREPATGKFQGRLQLTPRVKAEELEAPASLRAQ